MTLTGVPMPLAMLRRCGVTRNPLCRSSDRLQGGIVGVLLFLALLTIPVAATFGSITYDNARESPAQGHPVQAAVRAQAQAIVVDPASGVMSWRAPVQWRGPYGQLVRAVVPVGSGTGPGDKVTVWVNSQGSLMAPSMTGDQRVEMAVGATVVVLFGTWLVLGLVGLVACALLNRARAAAWEADWQRVGPEWTGRSPQGA